MALAQGCYSGWRYLLLSFIALISVALIVAPLMAVTVNLMSVVVLTLWLTGLLCLLNVVFAIAYRKRDIKEVISYYAAGSVELIIFVFAMLLYSGVISAIPYHLPPGLPVNRAEIGAALAFGIGLFPAAYWHRINLSELPRRIAEDGQVIKDRDGGVRVRKSSPGEWMN